MTEGAEHVTGAPGPLAIAMSGGGARAAYQVGVMVSIAKRLPDLAVPVLTGVSAGAINAAYYAQSPASFRETTERLAALWRALTPEQVFRSDAPALGWNVIRWCVRLLSGGASVPQARGLVDTAPLRTLLRNVLRAESGTIAGVRENLERGTALGARDHRVELHDGKVGDLGERRVGVDVGAARAHEPPVRAGRRARDGVIGGAAALSGDLGRRHLVRRRRHATDRAALPRRPPRARAASWPCPRAGARGPTRRPRRSPYPPPAQVGGAILEAIFLDTFDADALRLEQTNALIERLPPEQRFGLRKVDLLVLRPSVDIGKIVGEYERHLPRSLRFLMRGLGTQQTRHHSLLSMLMFQRDYLDRLISLGEQDADANPSIVKFLA